MDEQVFSELADLALKTSGLLLGASKLALAEARLTPLLRREGFASVAELLGCIRARDHDTLALETVSRLASRESWFFRDGGVLTHLVREALVARAANATDNRLRIWCAGAGAGQEAYSLAILIAETPALAGLRIDILATDLCADSVARIRSGVYGHFEIQRGLSVARMLTHFRPTGDGAWQALRPLRERIAVRQHNLLDGCEGFGQFDAILCRNVLSGMAQHVQASILPRLAAQLRPGAHLVLGADETPAGAAGLIEPNNSLRGLWLTSADAEAAAA